MKVETTKELANKHGCQEVSEHFGGCQPKI